MDVKGSVGGSEPSLVIAEIVLMFFVPFRHLSILSKSWIFKFSTIKTIFFFTFRQDKEESWLSLGDFKIKTRLLNCQSHNTVCAVIQTLKKMFELFDFSTHR